MLATDRKFYHDAGSESIYSLRDQNKLSMLKYDNTKNQPFMIKKDNLLLWVSYEESLYDAFASSILTHC